MTQLTTDYAGHDHGHPWFPFFPLIPLTILAIVLLACRRRGGWHRGDPRTTVRDLYAQGQISEEEMSTRLSALRTHRR